VDLGDSVVLGREGCSSCKGISSFTKKFQNLQKRKFSLRVPYSSKGKRVNKTGTKFPQAKTLKSYPCSRKAELIHASTGG
jgi:hypothetical protein